jgi:hypothetical protein
MKYSVQLRQYHINNTVPSYGCRGMNECRSPEDKFENRAIALFIVQLIYYYYYYHKRFLGATQQMSVAMVTTMVGKYNLVH